MNTAAAHDGRELAAEGLTTVALDDDGNLVEYRPDGSTVRLLAAPLTGAR